ncbi:MAG TPA: hypothetical protein EYP14_06780, partial [Planctomycetaceae bacterium]|nr:hypothetical protein [Planctomycetaceae bacterium]
MAERDPVEVLAEEFAQRYRRGERPSLDEYVRRYPQYADRLRRTFRVLLLMEDVAAEVEEESVGDALCGETLCGQVLGDFRVIRGVGRGGMGVVYEAEQVSLGRRVALKVLPPHVWLHLKHKKRFDREVRAAAQLHHTNIVPVFGVGEHEGLHYYVMQFIEGCTLAEVLDRLRRLRDGYRAGDLGAFPLEHAFAATLGQAPQQAAAGRAGQRLEPSASEPPADSAAGRAATSRGLSSRPSASSEPRAAEDTSVSRLADTDSLPRRPAVPAWAPDAPGNYWHAVARIGVQVASALQYAHS